MAQAMHEAMGFVETRGLIAAIEAADAMLKTAQVSLVAMERTDAAMITVQIAGDTAAVQAAVEAGTAAAKKIGQVVTSHVIARPSDDVRAMQSGKKASPTPKVKIATATKAAVKKAAPAKQAPAKVPAKAAPKKAAAKTPKAAPANSPLEDMTVRELRSLARTFDNLPIQGREIARASKTQLVDALRNLR
ncbi:MAG: BMC domain-containing protein [Bacteroidetes bacterium]|nr:BMC domain-containing protein [Bacteroidota bacterium]